MVEKRDKKIEFNLSPSSLNTFYKSPLLFYLTYIAKVLDDTKVPVCYGLSGRIVHDCLEKYAKKEFDRDGAIIYLIEQWDKYNLDNHPDIKNEPLKKEEYILALINGLKIVDKHDNHICEEIIKFDFIENEDMKIGIKGVIDLQAKENNEDVILDYKTSNSINQSKDFERQALFYNYLIKKKKDVIPKKTSFHYLKLSEKKEYHFSEEDIIAFEKELKIISNQILEFGKNISNYPIGDINDLFNSKKNACISEVKRRNNLSDSEIAVYMNFY
jgi:CRISPR/Cas system-associated exonuclease Cas4 (RecB family)